MILTHSQLGLVNAINSSQKYGMESKAEAASDTDTLQAWFDAIYIHIAHFHIYTDRCVLMDLPGNGSAAIICSSHSIESPVILS